MRWHTRWEGDPSGPHVPLERTVTVMEEKHSTHTHSGHTHHSGDHHSRYSRPGNEVDLKEFEEDMMKEPETLEAEETPAEETGAAAGNGNGKKTKKTEKKKKKRALLIVLVALLSLIVLALVAVIGVFTYFYNRSSYHPDESSISLDPAEVASIETIDPKSLIPDDFPTIDPGEIVTIDPDDPDNPGVPIDPDDPDSPIVAPTPDNTKPVDEIVRPASEIPKVGSVYNILLIGVDREGQKGTNSDTMILVSINSNKKTIYLTSIMRDSAAQIPGYGFIKINSAFAVGGFNTGAQLLTETIRYNFGFPVYNYAWINFGNMKNIMDLIGGIDIYLTVKEARFIGISISSPQVVHLSGAQALMHARDRSSGGSDYGRTQRQRNVIMAVLNKARSGGLGNLVNLANEILPYVHHNVDAGTVASLLLKLGDYVNYNVEQMRIPIDGSFYSANGNLIMDFQRNSNAWRNMVY